MADLNYDRVRTQQLIGKKTRTAEEEAELKKLRSEANARLVKGNAPGQAYKGFRKYFGGQ